MLSLHCPYVVFHIFSAICCFNWAFYVTWIFLSQHMTYTSKMFSSGCFGVSIYIYNINKSPLSNTVLVQSESESQSVMSDSLGPHGLYSLWNSPSQNTGVGSRLLLQGIFPTQGSNPGLPNCRRILYQLSHKGSPRILEWVAYPFSQGSSRPRNRTGVCCIAGEFFTNWAQFLYQMSPVAHTRVHSWFLPSHFVCTAAISFINKL